MQKRKSTSKRYSKPAGSRGARRGSEATLALQAQRAALGRAAAAELLLGWGQGTAPPPPRTMAMSINHIRDAVLKALACIEGKKALDGIADVLDKHGQSLTAETKQELVDAGEKLWDNLVRLGCPV